MYCMTAIFNSYLQWKLITVYRFKKIIRQSIKIKCLILFMQATIIIFSILITLKQMSNRTERYSVVIHTSVSTSAVADWVLARASRSSSEATSAALCPGTILRLSLELQRMGRIEPSKEYRELQLAATTLSSWCIWIDKILEVASQKKIFCWVDGWKKCFYNNFLFNLIDKK